jgi:hypothetical protein
VVGADGTEQTIATESVREDKKREWLFLSAQNFTFSAPTIKVKLMQDKPLSAAPSQSDKPMSSTTALGKQSAPVKKAAPKLKVINCIKGKMSKKVSGTNPKCPSGYKTK